MNSIFINNELEWLTKILFHRVESYLGSKGMDQDIFELYPPAVPKGDSGAYERFIKEHGMSDEDRLCLILSFAPVLKPQVLDCLCVKNSDTGRPFLEFGCRESRDGRGLLPTIETLLFAVAGTDMEKRLSCAGRILRNEFLAIHCMGTEGSATGELFNSTSLRPSEELIDMLLFDRPFEPGYSSGFPAKKLSTNRSWDDLVLDELTASQVDEIRLWVEFGERVRAEWGLKDKLRPGYRALFYGPPGSGKTFTASLLGKRTGKDVYRIDLSSVVSKYIGETEKNLGKVFSIAEGKEWILFFDEADALFGKRTGIKDSHDRYANQEVSYLLQRIEDYPGLVVLSTNQRLNIDDAFARRFQSAIKFPMPNPEQRKQLWLSAFSDKTSFEDIKALDDISRKYELTGGSIMNVVQFASVMAMSRGETVIRTEDILLGIRRELSKEGKVVQSI